MSNDPIADMLTRMKNAALVGHTSLFVPASNLKEKILEVLQKERYICSFVKKGRKVRKVLQIELAEEGKLSKIKGVKRVSKPSRRVYQSARDLRPSRSLGHVVVSTPKGVMTARQARREKLGGEVLFEIW